MTSLKLGSSSRSKLSSQDSSDSTASTSLEGTEPILEKGRDNVKVEPVRPALPRTRDDSSDEDEQTTLANNGVFYLEQVLLCNKSLCALAVH